jgi:predicted secreted hydrolase
MLSRGRLATVVTILGFGVACSRAPATLLEVPAPSPTPAPPIVFPIDAEPHSALTEWWYYTGHLAASDGHAYGFEFVIFQAQRENAPTGYLAHFAISDIEGQRFSHQARFTQADAASTGFPLDVNGWTLDHDGSTDTLEAAMQPGPGAEAAYALRLQLSDQKPAALHNGGYIDYGPAGGSYYYSRTRLAATGSLVLPDGGAVAVSGIAWMDHQWGNFVVSAAGGWDWYSLQLADMTELMLYVLRSSTGETTSVYGTRVLGDGRVKELLPGMVTTSATGSWTSPHTGGVYPSGWRLTLEDGTQLMLQPSLEDQELWFPAFGAAMAYWEGAVMVAGDRTGVGYVELTGYATIGLESKERPGGRQWYCPVAKM